MKISREDFNKIYDELTEYFKYEHDYYLSCTTSCTQEFAWLSKISCFSSKTSEYIYYFLGDDGYGNDKNGLTVNVDCKDISETLKQITSLKEAKQFRYDLLKANDVKIFDNKEICHD